MVRREPQGPGQVSIARRLAPRRLTADLEVVVFYIEPTASITDARLEIGGVPFRCGQRQVNVDQLVIEVLTRGVEQPRELAEKLPGLPSGIGAGD